jgi:hypothetical protein
MVWLYSFFNLGGRCGWVDNATPWPLYPLEIDRVPTVQEAGWGPETVWMGAENVLPTGIRSPDRPALSESLYRLSYPGPLKNLGTSSKFLAPEWWYKEVSSRSPSKIGRYRTKLICNGGLTTGVCAPLG